MMHDVEYLIASKGSSAQAFLVLKLCFSFSFQQTLFQFFETAQAQCEHHWKTSSYG